MSFIADKLYAKSNPIETLKEHTDQLIENYHLLRRNYPHILSQRLWDLLWLAVLYHDTGKVYPVFQNVIRKKIGLPLLPTIHQEQIPHNYLSVLFVPLNEIKREKNLTREEEKVLLQAIAYHHERKKDVQSLKGDIIQVIEQGLNQWIPMLEREMGIPIAQHFKRKILGSKITKRIEPYHPAFTDYVLVKGLLHRLDHAASAHEKVEMHAKESIAEYTLNAFGRGKLRELQQFALANQEKNLVLVASTGLGKTEAGFLWLGREKGIFTLPLRVSINAIFKRTMEKIGYVEKNKPIAGLLHSSARDYLEKHVIEEDETDSYSNEQIFYQSRLLSRKLTLTTIDQVLTFPLLFKGFEKWYATFAYSKLIIDEVQAYSPRIAAVIIKALEMIHQLSGKFLIMTATLPSYFVEELRKRTNNDFRSSTFMHSQNRHRISIHKDEIFSAIPKIVKLGKNQKILVICNTVKQSVKMYEAIQDQGCAVHLLHSRFMMKDRDRLENDILAFAKNSDERRECSGIWITTQIVEASLDVDFDVLFTELSVLDSLFQRMGRCYRNRLLDSDQPNVYIYIENSSGIGSVYDSELYQISKQLLSSYHQKFLTEKRKIDLVSQLYSEEKIGTSKFLREFKKSLNVLDTLECYQTSRSEAGKMIREIDQIQVIPWKYYDQLEEFFARYQELLHASKKNSIQDRKELRDIVIGYTISVPRYMVSRYITPINQPGFYDLYMIDLPYDLDKGLILEERIEDHFI